eukprot:7383705-Prymnesium_polylepis.1
MRYGAAPARTCEMPWHTSASGEAHESATGPGRHSQNVAVCSSGCLSFDKTDESLTPVDGWTRGA